MIEIYTDGACKGNPGKGAWAAIIIRDGNKTRVSGSRENTTNNQMELTAVIRALETLGPGQTATVFSDSQYVINSITRNWKRNANLELWRRLDLITKDLTLTWKWVKGHSGHPLNEEADQLANEEVEKMKDAPNNITHLDESGNASMVDISAKTDTQRSAVAVGFIKMNSATLLAIKGNQLSKGDVLGVARIAGIMAAKSTPQLIPLCHQINLNDIKLEFNYVDEHTISITATAKAEDKTGVEMEALSAVSISALTIYDMCKGIDKTMSITDISLINKTGGKSTS
jgi:cyclic pyranopterin phosphate synthase